MYRLLLVFVFSAITVATDDRIRRSESPNRSINSPQGNIYDTHRIIPWQGSWKGLGNEQEHVTNHSFPPCKGYQRPSKITGCKGLESGKRYLISDNGGMLTRCFQCSKPFSSKYEQTVTTNGTRGDSSAQWTFELAVDGCFIKSDIGAYIGRCSNCWLGETKQSEALFNHVAPEDAKKESYSRWKVEKHDGNKVAFKSDLGTYMTRCEDCLYPNGAFVHATAPEGPALWSVECV